VASAEERKLKNSVKNMKKPLRLWLNLDRQKIMLRTTGKKLGRKLDKV
jgi:hypothetical protein